MITKIGLIEGEILTLLEEENGPMDFNYLRSSLREADHLIWMSLGCLICERYIDTIEKCSTVKCKNIGKIYERKSLEFNEIHGNRLAGILNKEPVAMARHIFCVAAEILSLLEACGGLLSFETIGSSLNEPKEDILMALGWLIRQGYVRNIGARELIISRLPKETADLNCESLCEAGHC